MIADMDLDRWPMANGVSGQNILSGDRSNASQWIINGESGVLICKIGNMAFPSPNGFSQFLPPMENS
jgi:hypothetical protein